MAIVAFRSTGSAFALTRYAMVPSPCPVWPETSSTHDADADADQVHSRSTVTLTSPVPPEELKLLAVFVSVAWHRVALGPVTFVTALLPHAAAIDAHTANSRGRTGMFTRNPDSSSAPTGGIA